jgi:hypothetical protein
VRSGDAITLYNRCTGHETAVRRATEIRATRQANGLARATALSRLVFVVANGGDEERSSPRYLIVAPAGRFALTRMSGGNHANGNAFHH